MVRVCRLLYLNLLKPGILPGRLVKMSVDADISVYGNPSWVTIQVMYFSGVGCSTLCLILCSLMDEGSIPGYGWAVDWYGIVCGLQGERIGDMIRYSL
ncbi:MAG TPA: hypothetical protein VN372_01645 [Methanospirillum sp.]|nr:hypothetical protein [Methanospirillum sp.]